MHHCNLQVLSQHWHLWTQLLNLWRTIQKSQFTVSIEDFIFAGSTNSTSDKLPPNTFREAYSEANAEFWKSAVEEELQSLNFNHVYKTVLIPDGTTLITFKPVSRIKHMGRVWVGYGLEPWYPWVTVPETTLKPKLHVSFKHRRVFNLQRGGLSVLSPLMLSMSSQAMIPLMLFHTCKLLPIVLDLER